MCQGWHFPNLFINKLSVKFIIQVWTPLSVTGLNWTDEGTKCINQDCTGRWGHLLILIICLSPWPCWVEPSQIGEDRWITQLDHCLAADHLRVSITLLEILHYNVCTCSKGWSVSIGPVSSWIELCWWPDSLPIYHPISSCSKPNTEGAKLEVYCNKLEVYCNPCLKWSFPHFKGREWRGCKSSSEGTRDGAAVSKAESSAVLGRAGHSWEKHGSPCRRRVDSLLQPLALPAERWERGGRPPSRPPSLRTSPWARPCWTGPQDTGPRRVQHNLSGLKVFALPVSLYFLSSRSFRKPIFRLWLNCPQNKHVCDK